MDRYPEVNISQHEYSSHSSSKTPSFTKVTKVTKATKTTKATMHQQQTPDADVQKTPDAKPSPSEYTSFPLPSTESERDEMRNDSFHNETAKSKQIHADYAHYTDAPPPFSEDQYEGKSEEQQTQMRMTDYAKEINRMMGRQLVRDLKSGETKGTDA
jgi:hypothetical protein